MALKKLLYDDIQNKFPKNSNQKNGGERVDCKSKAKIDHVPKVAIKLLIMICVILVNGCSKNTIQNGNKIAQVYSNHSCNDGISTEH